MAFTMIVDFRPKPGAEQRLHDELNAMVIPERPGTVAKQARGGHVVLVSLGTDTAGSPACYRRDRPQP